ncbi:unnamed protein product, partial [Symbiodinium sp. CCMP2592]
VRILKKKKAGSGNKAVQARLHGVPGAWSQSKKAEAGTSRPERFSSTNMFQARARRRERLSSTNMGSQVRALADQVAGWHEFSGKVVAEINGVERSCAGSPAWCPRCVVSVEEGGGRDEAGALILTQYGVPGAWSQPEEGDEAGALFLNQYVPGACSEAGALILNQYRCPQPMWGSRCVVSVEEGGGRDEAGALILNQYGVPGAWSQPEEGDEAGALFLNQYVPGACSEAGALILNQYGVPGAKAEAGTRPERLSSTNVESQVRDLGPKKVKVGCLKPEEGELQEEATTGSKDLLSEDVLGAWSQPEEDGGGDKVRGLNLKRMEAGVLNQYRVRGAWSQLEQVRKFKMKKTQVWKFKLKKTEAWKLKLKKGKDKALILKQNAGKPRKSRHVYPQPEEGQGVQPPRLSGARRRGAAATLILNQNGGQGKEAQRRGAAATLILNQNGGQGEEAKRCSRHAYPQPEWGRRDAAATPILNQNGGQGEEAQPRRGAAATLILNQNGGEEVQPPRLSSTRSAYPVQGEEVQPPRLILKPEWGARGKKAQPPRLSSTRIGARGYSRHAYPVPGEEVQPRRGAAATFILNQNGGQGEEAQPPRLSSTRIAAATLIRCQAKRRRGAAATGGQGEEVKWCSRHAYPQPEWGPGGRGAAATLILNQNGGQGEEAQRRGAAATLILNQNGGQGKEAQPPRLSSTRMHGGQGLQPPRLSGARRRGAAATLILTQNGGQGDEAQPPRLSSTRIGARGYSRHAYPVPGEEVQPPRLSSTRMTLIR